MEKVPYQVPAIVKAFDILSYLAKRNEASFSEIYSELGLPKSTTSQILSTLLSLGCVRKIDYGPNFALGLVLFELGSLAASRLDLRSEAMAVLRTLVTNINETCNLGILDGVEGVYLAKLEGTQPVRLYSWEGKRLHLHCTAIGKVLLTWQEKTEQEKTLKNIELVAHTKNTITKLGSLIKELEIVRKRGWALDDQENEPHIRCVGAPVLSVDGHVMAAISISGLATRFDGEYLSKLVQEVQKAAFQLSERLGGSLASRTLVSR